MQIEVREEAAGRGSSDQGYQTHTIARKQQPLQKVACDQKIAISLPRKQSRFSRQKRLTSLPKLTADTTR